MDWISLRLMMSSSFILFLCGSLGGDERVSFATQRLFTRTVEADWQTKRFTSQVCSFGLTSRTTCCLDVLYTMLKVPTKGSLHDLYERRVHHTIMIPPARSHVRVRTRSKKHSELIRPYNLCLSCRGHVELVPLFSRGSGSHSSKREFSACAVSLTSNTSMEWLWKDTFGNYISATSRICRRCDPQPAVRLRIVPINSTAISSRIVLRCSSGASHTSITTLTISVSLVEGE